MTRTVEESRASSSARAAHGFARAPPATVVTMTGTNQYVGLQSLKVAGTAVTTLHFREVAQFGGGQTGSNISDTWFSTVDGLPVRGTWTTRVNSPTFVGSSTLIGRGSYTLASLSPKS